MRVVYVGDNRNRGNFGCRGTSTALSQLISQQNTIVGRISGKYTNWDTGEVYVVNGKNEKFYVRKSKNKYWKYEKKFLYYWHKLCDGKGKFLMGKHDFASLDFEKAIQNLINCLPANPDLKELDLRQYDFDALVVNGEGSFIFSTPSWIWRDAIVESVLMYWALKMGKKVYYLNGMLSDDPNSKHNDDTIKYVKNIFNSCQAVCVREYKSVEYAKKYFPNIKLKVFPDALFTWYDLVNDNHVVNNGRYYIPHSAECDENYSILDFSRPYICVSGSSAIIKACNGNIEIAIMRYCNLIQKIKERVDFQVFLVIVDDGDEFLNEVAKMTNTPIIPMDMPLVAAAKILANSRVYISGRYHPAIMASLGGTPCVFMSSNSHKTESIQELLEYDTVEEFNLLPDDNECTKIVEAAIRKMNDPKLRKKIKQRSEYLSIQASGLARVIE